MKLKKLVCLLAIVALALASFAGCGYNPKTVMTVNGMDLPAGVFLYLQIEAYTLAETELNGELMEGATLLDAIIDGKPARQWIADKTDQLIREYVFVEQEFERLEATLDEFELYYAEYYADQSWSSYSSFYTKNGISFDTFKQLYYNQVKSGKLLTLLYAGDGELAVEASAKEEYFHENYTRTDYFVFPATTYDEAPLSEDELSQVREIADAMLTQANSRNGSLSQAYIDHYNDILLLTGEALEENGPIELTEDDYLGIARINSLVNSGDTSLDADFIATLLAADLSDRYALYAPEDSSVIIIYRRLALEETDTAESYDSNIISALAQDDLDEYIESSAATLEIVQDDRARAYYSVDKIKQ